MKITSQTADDMVLKEGSASGIVLGAVFVLIGISLAFYVGIYSPALWIEIVFVVLGLGSIFFSSSITADFNKTNGQLSYQKKRLIGGQTTTYAIADILRIETRKEWRMQSSSTNRGASMPRQVLISQSVIVFKDGREVPLDHQKSSSSATIGPAVMMSGQGVEVAVANQVAKFLGVPFQEIAQPNPGIDIGIGAGGIRL